MYHKQHFNGFSYRGNVIYRNGAVDMVLFPGGYATLTGGVRFHYYTQDYLGNNRAVINGSTGAIEQTTAYYPYGGIIPDLGTPTTGQPYRFGGKELTVANGLNEYDFGARQYYSAVPGFTRIDPMAEKYPWLSPYLYCANNPVNLIDPSGMTWQDPYEAEMLKKEFDGKINSYKIGIDLLNNLDRNDKTVLSLISELEQRISNLNISKTDIDLLGEDKNHVYSFYNVSGDGAHYVQMGNDNEVIIQTSGSALSLHEITHVRQSLEAGGPEFNSEGYLKNPGGKESKHINKYRQITKNETEAYTMQYSFDPFSMPIKVTNIGSIDVHYVGSIKDSNGKPVYKPIFDYSNHLKLQNQFK